MTGEQLIKAQLVEFAWQEAGATGSLVCMLGVMQILRNRVKAGWQGGDWLAVIDAAWAGTQTLERRAFDLGDDNFDTVLREVEDIYYGVDVDEFTMTTHPQTNRAVSGLYWCFIDRPISEWFAAKIIRQPEQHPRIAQNGNMYVYA